MQFKRLIVTFTSRVYIIPPIFKVYVFLFDKHDKDKTQYFMYFVHIFVSLLRLLECVKFMLKCKM